MPGGSSSCGTPPAPGGFGFERMIQTARRFLEGFLSSHNEIKGFPALVLPEEQGAAPASAFPSWNPRSAGDGTIPHPGLETQGSVHHSPSKLAPGASLPPTLRYFPWIFCSVLADGSQEYSGSQILDGQSQNLPWSRFLN